MASSITLNGGAVVLLDDEDLERMAARTWRLMRVRINGTEYQSYARSSTGRLALLMHHEIMGAGAGEYVDHINRNGLDNRKENLRVCSQSQNLCNAKRPVTNTSGVKGVTWNKDCRKWVAQLQKHGKHYYGGLFVSLDEAAAKVAQMRLALHGEFSRAG